MTFQLHERLAADTALIGDLALCRALLMNDSRYPWMILVPRLAGLREIHQLDMSGQQQLLGEMTGISAAMENHFNADKMNVAAIGNMVPQLHIHVIARFKDDAVWPAPVWGRGSAVPYEDIGRTLEDFKSLIRI